MKRLTVVLGSAAILSANTLNDWAGRSGFQLLNRPFGVATISRGEAATALPGSFSRWYNPALYGADSGYSVEFEFSKQSKYSERTSAAFDLGIRFNDVFLGFEGSNHVESAGYPVDDFGTTVPDMSGDPIMWQSSELSLSVGRKRTDKLTWGGTLGTAFDQVDGEAAYAVLLGLGVQARFLDERLLFGLSALNWGVTTPMIDNGHEEFATGEKLPSTVRTGIAWNQPLKQGKIAVATDAVYHHVYDTSKSVKEELGNRISYPLGIEYSPVKWVDLRAGHEINNGTAVANFGAGVNSHWVDADLGFVVNKFGSSRELNWMAGVKFHLGATPKVENDPYKDKKRAVYRPASTVAVKKADAISDFAKMADSAKVDSVGQPERGQTTAKIDSVGQPPRGLTPSKVEPAKVEPAKVEPAKVEPAKVEPAKVEVKTVPVDSSKTGPKPAEKSNSGEEELGLE